MQQMSEEFWTSYYCLDKLLKELGNEVSRKENLIIGHARTIVQRLMDSTDPKQVEALADLTIRMCKLKVA